MRWTKAATCVCEPSSFPCRLGRYQRIGFQKSTIKYRKIVKRFHSHNGYCKLILPQIIIIATIMQIFRINFYIRAFLINFPFLSLSVRESSELSVQNCVYICEHCVCEHIWKIYFSANFLRTRGKWQTDCDLLVLEWKLLVTKENLPATWKLTKIQTNVVLTEPRTYFVFVKETDWRWFATNCLQTLY